MKNQTTRKEKREAEKQINFFEEFLKIRKHFFCNFNQKLKSIKDVPLIVVRLLSFNSTIP